jgi:O-Antigen ligase
VIQSWTDARPKPLRTPLLVMLIVVGIAACTGLLLIKLGPYFGPAIVVGLVVVFGMLLAPVFSLLVVVATLTAQWPFQLPKLVGIVGLASTAASCMVRRRRLVVTDPLFLLTLAFLGAVLFSVVTAETRVGIVRGASTYLSFAAMFWMMLVLVESERTAKLVVGAFLLSNIANALIGLAQYKVHFLWIVSQVRALQAAGIPVEVQIHQGFRGSFRIDALTGTPDLLAMNMVAAIPFAMVGLWRARNAPQRLGWLGVLAILTIALALTYSRGSIVGLAAVGLVIVGKMGLRRASPLILLAGALMCGLLILSPTARDRVVSSNPFRSNTVESDTGQLEAAAWRLKSYRYGLYMMRDHALIPAGVNQQPLLWKKYAPQLVQQGAEWTTPLHNTYMLAVVELGFWGGALYLAILVVTWTTLRSARQLLLKQGREDLAGFALAAELAIVGIAVANQFYPLIEFRYFWFFAALAAVLLRLSHRRESETADA